jgi:hypothetical protein
MRAAELAEFLKAAVPYECANRRHSWLLHIAGQSRHDTTVVPAELFDELDGGELRYENTWRTYDSRAQAQDALIDAAIRHMTPRERAHRPECIDPLPIIRLWLASSSARPPRDASRSELRAWLAETFPDVDGDLAADTLIAAGIGRHDRASPPVSCTATYSKYESKRYQTNLHTG